MIEVVVEWTKHYFASTSSAELGSMMTIALPALLFVVLERAFPYNKGQAVLRGGFFDDFALYTIAQSYILGIVIFSWIIKSIDVWTGLSRFHLLSH